jgi:four helix bundle protein
MPVWKVSHELSISIFHLTASLPRSEDYGLTSQIRRSSNSVAANISEAYGRKTNKDKANFYTIARGSALETQSHILYGEKVGYFDSTTAKIHMEEYAKLIHELNKIIKTILSQP